MQGFNRKPDPDGPKTYQIRIQGHLDGHWSEWFDDLDVTYDERDDTLLTGPVADQAALHGLLIKVRDLGLPLISVCRANAANQVEHDVDLKSVEDRSGSF